MTYKEFIDHFKARAIAQGYVTDVVHDWIDAATNDPNNKNYPIIVLAPANSIKSVGKDHKETNFFYYLLNAGYKDGVKLTHTERDVLWSEMDEEATKINFSIRYDAEAVSLVSATSTLDEYDFLDGAIGVKVDITFKYYSGC